MLDCPFKGLGTALVTPFLDDESIDWFSLEQLIEEQISGGVDFLVPCGTTGEAPTLGDQEHINVISFVVEKANGRVPVVAGTGSNSTAHTVHMTKKADDIGADGVLVVVPYYNKPTQRGMIEHFRRVADVGLPVVVYNIPGRTGVNMLPETLATLAEHRHIVGLKDATGAVNEQALENMRLCGDRLVYFSGDDGRALEYIQNGGNGLISVVSNLVPVEITKLVSTALAGDWERAHEIHSKLSILFAAIFLETNPLGIKQAMAEMHWIRPVWRLPMFPPSFATVEEIQGAMDQLNLI